MHKHLYLGLMGAFCVFLPGIPAAAQEVNSAVHHDTSPALHAMSRPPLAGPKHEKPLFRLDHAASNQTDPVVQTSAGPLVGTSVGLNFAGVGDGDYGFAPDAAPPDTEGVVGATQYVQWVNESFAVFNKTTGALELGPTPGNSLWNGFGGGCQSNNDGDPIVQYDKAAQRWVFTQFSVSTTPYLQCVAVSTTSDATGTYHRYSFQQPNFPDYPKLGVWPDAYYVSFNMFSGNSFVGGRACAFDRTAMLAGAAATQICFQLGNTFGGLLPSDLDGSTAPPAGSPNFFLAFATNSLDLWKFHVDFATPANATFTGPTKIPVAVFSPACNGGGTCIPQSGTNQQLDSLADRLMYRLAYRNFGDHEALVANHSVTAGNSVGLRWYELRSPNATPTVFQQGTYAPDSNYRWMGSVAMDQAGNIALGYSVSSSSMNPAIRYTGRVPGDALGTMETENIITTGTGSQNGGLTRWGDYSAMTIDPGDDCTFFYTNEYLKTTGSFNWSTRIASFKFPSCGAPPVLTTINVSPSSASVQTSGQKQFSATALDQFGNPMSPQPTFTWSVTGVGSIAQTGLFSAGLTAGSSTVKAANGTGTVSGTASVTVTAPPVLTTITVSPSSASVQTGGQKQFSAVGFDQFGNPMSPQPPFTWTVSGADGTIDSTGLFTAGGTAGGPFTVKAASGSVSGTASVTVTAVPTFTISTSAPILQVRHGSSKFLTVNLTAGGGTQTAVTLSISGLPSRTSSSFSSNPVTPTGTSTLTISVNRKAALGSSTVTVTGKNTAGYTQTTTFTLQIQ